MESATQPATTIAAAAHAVLQRLQGSLARRWGRLCEQQVLPGRGRRRRGHRRPVSGHRKHLRVRHGLRRLRAALLPPALAAPVTVPVTAAALTTARAAAALAAAALAAAPVASAVAASFAAATVAAATFAAPT